jgi:fructose-bisphosphate aldolase class 1
LKTNPLDAKSRLLNARFAVQQLSSIGVPNEEKHRQALRELLFTSPGIENHISGVVRFLKTSTTC